MSKYNALWDYVRSQSAPLLTLSFDEIQQIAGIPIDHSFLQYKKKLTEYGWQVQKISMKEKIVCFALNPHFSPLAQETSAGFFLPKFAKKPLPASTLLPA